MSQKCKHDDMTVVLEFGEKALALCDNCEKPFSRMFDLDTREEVWVPGNFILGMSESLYILAYDYTEYEKAVARIKRVLSKFGGCTIYIHDTIMINDLDRATIMFYGNWFDRDDIRNPNLTRLINMKM